MYKKILWGLALTTVFMAGSANAQIPRQIAYQGILTDKDGNVRPDSTYTVTFSIYDAASGGSALWTEEDAVATSRGMFAVELGAKTPFALSFDKPYWIGVSIDGEQIAPRVKMAATPYSLRADTAEYAKNIPEVTSVAHAERADTAEYVKNQTAVTNVAHAESADTAAVAKSLGGGAVATGGSYINNDGTATTGLYFDTENKPQFISTTGASGDAKFGLRIVDTNSYALGVGGALAFDGKYNSIGSSTVLGGIKAYKANAIDGDYSAQLHFQTRLNGSTPETRMIIDENGNVGVGVNPVATSKLSLFTSDSEVYDPYSGKSNLLFLRNLNNSNNDGVTATVRMMATANNGKNNAGGYMSLIQNNASSHASDMAFQLRMSSGEYVEMLRLKSNGTIQTNDNYINNDGTAKVGLQFNSDNSPTIRIDTSGRVIVRSSNGSTNDNSPKLSFFGDGAADLITGPSIQKIRSGSYGRGSLAFIQHNLEDYTSEIEAMSIASNGSVIVGSPTDGGKGFGTINAEAIYDDNVQLTGYVLDKAYSKYYDAKKWDSKSATGLHEPARDFESRSKEMFDIDAYMASVKKQKALPTFEEIEKAEMVPSTGELAQKLWEVVEIQTVHIDQLNERIKKLEAAMERMSTMSQAE